MIWIVLLRRYALGKIMSYVWFMILGSISFVAGLATTAYAFLHNDPLWLMGGFGLIAFGVYIIVATARKIRKKMRRIKKGISKLRKR